jgi:hypothetical protein
MLEYRGSEEDHAAGRHLQAMRISGRDWPASRTIVVVFTGPTPDEEAMPAGVATGFRL